MSLARYRKCLNTIKNVVSNFMASFTTFPCAAEVFVVRYFSSHFVCYVCV